MGEMPVKYQKGFISDRDFVQFMVVIVLLGFGIGALLFLGIPALWELVKPLIHAATE